MVHLIALDGTWLEDGGELAWEGLLHLRTSDVGEVLERLLRRMESYLRMSGQLRTFEDESETDGEGDPEGDLAASAVFGHPLQPPRRWPATCRHSGRRRSIPPLVLRGE